jgi:CRP/FNR family cyclic AMP-dependent transcriptional regulator
VKVGAASQKVHNLQFLLVPGFQIRQALVMRTLLQSVPILAGMDEAALNFISERSLESKAPAGSVILSEGEVGNRFFLVREGSVRVCKRFGQSDQLELATLGPGDFFGEMCILETLPRSATVQAVVDTVLFSVTSLTFYHLYKSIPSQYSILVLNIARDLSRRLRHLDEVFASRH